jgi:hypothetical protein
MKPSTALKSSLLGTVLMACLPAQATERFDHRGSLGLLLGGGFELSELVRSGQFEEYSRAIGSLGVTAAIGENGNELKLVVQAAKPGSVEWTAYTGYRGYFGQERLKTFFDLDLALDIRPYFTAGPRLAFGLQYELHPLVGLFAGLAVRVGIGSPTRFAASGFAGLQFRSYLLE